MPSALRVLRLAFGLAPLSLTPYTRSSVPSSLAGARKPVAVLTFDNNTGKADYDHLGKGMAAMLTTDLAKEEKFFDLQKKLPL